MRSALFAVVGVSLLAATAACDGGSDTEGGTGGTGAGPVMSAGSPATGGSGTGTAGSGTGTAGSGTGTPGIPLTPADGWVADTNAAKIQGALFSFADDYSKAGPPAMETTLVGTSACIKGVAAKVDLMCTKPAGMDCYGVYWGAALGLNLNQPMVPDTVDPTKMVGGMPMAYDATALKGFAFEIAAPAGGAGMFPTSLRFKVDDGSADVEYCTGGETPIKVGENVVTFDKLRTKCWEALAKQPTPMTSTSIQSKMVKIAWQVVTNDKTTVPFDFCVNNIRAIQ